MSVRECVPVVVLCLLAGCSDQQASPPQSTEAGRIEPAAPAIVSVEPKAVTLGEPAAAIQAMHVEQNDLPDLVPPTLLEQELADTAEGVATHQDADQVLLEAIKALRTKLAVISHNLANADTVGFKRSRVLLEDCDYRQLRLPGAQDVFNNYAPVGISVGQGCRVQGVELDFSQGTIEETSRPLDVAIEGDGFFQVVDPTTNDFLYTRNGAFALNSNGILVIGSAGTGRMVQPQISMPVSTIGVVISAEGNVSIQQVGQTQYSQIGQLQLAKFLNPQGLLKIGEHLYQETLASGAAVFAQPGTNGFGTLRQKSLERSNVDLDDELLAWKKTERRLKAFERLLDASEH